MVKGSIRILHLTVFIIMNIQRKDNRFGRLRRAGVGNRIAIRVLGVRRGDTIGQGGGENNRHHQTAEYANHNQECSWFHVHHLLLSGRAARQR